MCRPRHVVKSDRGHAAQSFQCEVSVRNHEGEHLSLLPVCAYNSEII